MAAMASWGDRVFSVEPGRILTFKDFSRSASFETKSEESPGEKPGTTNVGPGLETISFTVLLSATLGADVQKEADAWLSDCNGGAVHALFIGGKAQGGNSWQLTQVRMSDTEHMPDGRLIACTMDVTLTEYARDGAVKKKKGSKKKSPSASDDDASKKNDKPSGKVATPKSSGSKYPKTTFTSEKKQK